MKLRTIYLLAFFLLLYSCYSSNKKRQEHGSNVDSLQTLVMQVQKCSRLYTVEYNIHKIVTHDDVMRLRGTFLQKSFNWKMPIGDRKIAIPMDATLKAYIDFSQFGKTNIERHKGHIVVILPDPKVVITNTKIDQTHVKEYVSFLRSHFSDAEMADYEMQGRASILQSIPRLDIVNKAREDAVRILVPMLKNMGYDEYHITITFRHDFDPNDIKGLLDNTTINDERKD